MPALLSAVPWSAQRKEDVQGHAPTGIVVVRSSAAVGVSTSGASKKGNSEDVVARKVIVSGADERLAGGTTNGMGIIVDSSAALENDAAEESVVRPLRGGDTACDGLTARNPIVVDDGDAAGGNMAMESTSSAFVAAHAGRGAERFTSMSTDSILSTVWHRISILVSLLLFQSLSQFILERYETLLSQHVIVPLFLTMLVGAGGNAGNQSAVRSITGLVSGEFKSRDFWKVMRKELIVGLINSFIVASIGFSRVYYFYGHRNLFWSTLAITASLFCIVLSSVVLGTSLPFLLGRLGYDREHAAPIIQVLMDITGVLITCMLCTLMIPDSEHTTKSS